MIALLQRVTRASVDIGGERRASIGRGLLVLVGVKPEDDEPGASKLLHRLLNYRVFADEAGKMNLSLRQIEGGLLLVPQLLWRRIPATGCGRGSQGRRRPSRGVGCSISWCNRRSRGTPR
jgi:D-aminoacyl-tRNA deacylase